MFKAYTAYIMIGIMKTSYIQVKLSDKLRIVVRSILFNTQQNENKS